MRNKEEVRMPNVKIGHKITWTYKDEHTKYWRISAERMDVRCSPHWRIVINEMDGEEPEDSDNFWDFSIGSKSEDAITLEAVLFDWLAVQALTARKIAMYATCSVEGE
jgi:hypothetical protein